MAPQLLYEQAYMFTIKVAEFDDSMVAQLREMINSLMDGASNVSESNCANDVTVAVG